MWRTRAAGRLSPRVMHDLQVTAECFVHALPKVRVAKKTIERTTIPCTRRARHDTHTMATGSLGEGVPVVRRRLSYNIKYSVEEGEYEIGGSRRRAPRGLSSARG